MSIDLNGLLRAEIAKMEEISALPEWREQEQAWAEYWDHLQELPEDVRPLAGYECCRRAQTVGTSGFHGFGRSEDVPFSFCGWADYEYRPGRSTQGVGFRVNRACFGSRDAELYYMDDDIFDKPDSSEGVPGWIMTMEEQIRACSSGLADVRLAEEREEKDFHFRGRWHSPALVRSFRFRLDPKQIRETVLLGGKAVETDRLGGYVFVLPRAGEFFCELGEIVDGRRVPLHIDDFCMK